MFKKNNIPNTSVFFILLSNGDTHYFTVKKNNEIFKIYYNNIDYEYKADLIEFDKNGFKLKRYNDEIIYNLQDCYQTTNQSNKQPEIEIVYMDLELRKELLKRGQLTYTEDASRIPGIIYEPEKQKIDINKNEFFHEQIIDQDFYFDEEVYDEENTYEEGPEELPHYKRVRTIHHQMYAAHNL